MRECHEGNASSGRRYIFFVVYITVVRLETNSKRQATQSETTTTIVGARG